MQNLTNLTIAIMGGDAREVFLAEHLASLGAVVKTYGLPAQGANIVNSLTPKSCLEGVQALILPVPGVNEQMELSSAYFAEKVVLDQELLALLPVKAPVFTGVARKSLRELLEKNNLELIELMDLDEVAILNAIPSAEGAVQMAMEKLPITIHGAKALVVGFGRTGQPLAQLLANMHCHTYVAARNPIQLAKASSCGLNTLHLKELADRLPEVDVIFNTVPALVIDEKILHRLPVTTLIIDIASAPGGTDFAKALSLGLEAVLAPGLPGKAAPKTAGQILAGVIPDILLQKLSIRFRL